MSRYKASYRPAFWDGLLESSNWYDDKEPGLGGEFRHAVVELAESILENPHKFRVVDGELRRAVLTRFNHLIFFEPVGEVVYFVGIVHGMRNVPRWLQRISEEE